MQQKQYRKSLTYGFPTLQWCKNKMGSVGTALLVLNFDLFMGQYDAVLMLNISSEMQLPVSDSIAKTTNTQPS